eukprot:768287-Hanusia_phi.AAC.12
MISALAWVRRGKAMAVPKRRDDDDDDDEDEEEEEEEEVDSKENAVRRAIRVASAVKNDGELAEYGLDRYDEEDEEALGVLGAVGPPMFRSNMEDPYITLPDEEDDSDADEDNIIRPSDSLILACHSEEEGHTLDVYVYDDQEGTLFVHHDLMLNAFPLCLTWLDCARTDGSMGSYCAIGTMDPAIEVWDLDCLDALEPVVVLGGEDEAGKAELPASKGKKKKKKAKKALKEGSHKEAVLGLSWHPIQRHVLASASGDKTVKVWDVPRGQALHTLTHHSDKVQALQWHPSSAAVLLSGSFDKTAAVLDVRATAADWKAAGKWPVSSDVECVAWNPHEEHQFFVSTDSGIVTCHDARHAGSNVYSIGAHDKAVTGLAVNQQVNGLIATASLDKTLKLWDVRGGKAEYITTRNMDVDQVFCCSWCVDPEAAYVLAVGGKDGKLVVWDTTSNASIRQRFPTGRKEEDYEGMEEDMNKMNIDSEEDDSDSEEEAPTTKKKPVMKKSKGKGKK